MADMTIDQLNIEISADSQSASKSIDHLVSVLEKLESTVSSLGVTMNNISNSFSKFNAQTNQTANNSTQTKNAFEKLTETIKKEEKQLSKLKTEYASYVLKNQESSHSAEVLASRINNLSTDLNNNKARLEKAKNAADKLAVSNNNLGKSANNTSKSFGSFAQKLAQKISTTRTLVSVFQNMANTMADWFNESNEYIETLNLFNVTMGEGAEEARNFAENVSALMGIDPKEWMQYQGTFKNLTAGFGVASDKANVMSQNLTQLSYDMASFFNTDVETAFDKLSSAMSGQVKGLREFGIDTTVASLQEYALAKGIDASVRSMSQAEKSMLRYNYIMEKSIIMQGDMARTIITPANSLRILNAQLTQMKRALGNIVSVLVVKFIPYVQAMVQIITEAASALAKLFGFSEKDFEANVEGLDKTAWGTSDIEDNLDGASGQLKKIKKQLMGFDELNIISNPDSDSGSGGASVGGVGLDMGLESYDFLKGLETKNLDEIKEKLKDICKWALVAAGIFLAWKIAVGFAESLNILTTLFGSKGGGASSTPSTSGGGGASPLTTKLINLVKNLALALVVILEVAAAAALIVGAIWLLGVMLEQVGIAWQPVIDNGATVTAAMIIGTAILVGVGVVTNALGTAGTALITSLALGLAMLALIGVSAGLFILEIWAIGIGLTQIYEAWQPINGKGEEIATAIAIGTGLLIGIGVVTALLGAATVATAGALPIAIALGTALLVELAVAFEALVDSLVDVADQLTDELHPSLNRLNAVLPTLSENMEKFTGFMKKFAKLFVDYSKDSAISGFAATVNKIIDFFTADPIETMADDVNEQYKQATKLNEQLRLANPELQIAISLITTYYTFLEKIEELTGKTNNIKLANGMFVNMKEVGKNLVLGFVDGMKSENSTLAKGIKDVLDDTLTSKLANSYGETFGETLAKGVANGFKNSSFPTLYGDVDVKESGKVSLKLRAYAMGGFPDVGQMFIAREAGPELVGTIGNKTAVANNDQIISGIESGVYRAMMAANSNQGGSQTIRIINEIDGDVVGEKVIQYHNGRVMQTGTSPLLV